MRRFIIGLCAIVSVGCVRVRTASEAREEREAQKTAEHDRRESERLAKHQAQREEDLAQREKQEKFEAQIKSRKTARIEPEFVAAKTEVLPPADASCVASQPKRHAMCDAFQREKAENRRRRVAAFEWAAKHCKSATVTDYRRYLCEDASGYVRVCREPDWAHEELRCPAGAPKGVSAAGITTGKTAGEMPAWLALSSIAKENRKCGDVTNCDGALRAMAEEDQAEIEPEQH